MYECLLSRFNFNWTQLSSYSLWAEITVAKSIFLKQRIISGALALHNKIMYNSSSKACIYLMKCSSTTFVEHLDNLLQGGWYLCLFHFRNGQSNKLRLRNQWVPVIFCIWFNNIWLFILSKTAVSEISSLFSYSSDRNLPNQFKSIYDVLWTSWRLWIYSKQTEEQSHISGITHW